MNNQQWSIYHKPNQSKTNQRFRNGDECDGKRRKTQHHANYINFKIGQYSDKSPGNLMRNKFLDLDRELKKKTKKTMKHKGDGDTNYTLSTLNNPQRIVKVTGKLGNKRTRRV